MRSWLGPPRSLRPSRRAGSVTNNATVNSIPAKAPSLHRCRPPMSSGSVPTPSRMAGPAAPAAPAASRQRQRPPARRRKRRRAGRIRRIIAALLRKAAATTFPHVAAVCRQKAEALRASTACVARNRSSRDWQARARTNSPSRPVPVPKARRGPAGYQPPSRSAGDQAVLDGRGGAGGTRQQGQPKHDEHHHAEEHHCPAHHRPPSWAGRQPRTAGARRP